MTSETGCRVCGTGAALCGRHQAEVARAAQPHQPGRSGVSGPLQERRHD